MCWKPDTNRDFSSYQIQQLKTRRNQGRVWRNSVTSLAWGLRGLDFTVGQILIFWDRWFQWIESKLRRLRLSNAGPSHWPSTGPKPNQRPFTDATCTHCSLNQNQQEPHHRHDHRRLSMGILRIWLMPGHQRDVYNLVYRYVFLQSVSIAKLVLCNVFDKQNIHWNE